MPSPGDGPQTWDVLPSPASRDDLSLYRPDLYRPPAEGDRDPILLVGEPDKPGRRFRTSARAIPSVLALGLSGVSMAHSNVFWMVVIGVVVSVIIASTLVVASRRPVWTTPRLEINAETMTVTDVAGVTRVVAWSDVSRLHLATVAQPDSDLLLLTWVSATDGEGTSVSLGNTLDLQRVRVAIQDRLPRRVELEVGPGRAVKLG